MKIMNSIPVCANQAARSGLTLPFVRYIFREARWENLASSILALWFLEIQNAQALSAHIALATGFAAAVCVKSSLFLLCYPCLLGLRVIFLPRSCLSIFLCWGWLV